MGPVSFKVTNNSGYRLTISNNPCGVIGEVESGTQFAYDFDGSVEHNSNQMIFKDASDNPICSGSISWSAGGAGADDGWMEPVLFSMDGNMNGVGFSGNGEGWRQRLCWHR